jgi:uncharacterized protein (DUF1684 family)
VTRFLAPAAALLFALAAGGCTSGPAPGDDSAYLKEVADSRTDKDQQFRQLPECGKQAPEECSPVPGAKRTKVLPLRYYPTDTAFSVPAMLKLSNDRPVFEMPTSTGTIRRMQLVGSLQFTLKGQPQSLGAFVEEGTQEITTLFVPFADMTTGTETYSAGRYLDLNPTSSGYYTVDFNRAYNPYCAYSAAYECPYPPPSNRLKLAVTAGEKAPPA